MMTKIYFHVARIFLGTVLVGSVLVRTFAPHLLAGVSFPPAAQDWLNVMESTRYLQTLLYVTEFMTGLTLLIGIFVPLVVLILAPITLNIALFHIFLQPRAERIIQVILMLGAHALLAYHSRRSFTYLFCSASPACSSWKIGSLNVRLIIQIFLGLMFVLAGGAKLLVPDRLSVGDFLIDGMKATGYLYPLLGTTEFVAGLFLVTNHFVPLTLVILAPIMLNIFLYHVFLASVGLPVVFVFSGIYIALVISHFHAYRPLINFKD
jgi:putative oxidoreductase